MSEHLNTPLYSRHLALGATMAPFAGWNMPLWYKAGAIKEHLAVIQAAGLFDTSHMDVIEIRGKVRPFLDFAFSRDLSDWKPGRCAYGAFLAANGHCIDDAILYPFSDGRVIVVINAGMSGRISEHLARLPGADAVAITEFLPRPAKLDLQGPAAAAILREILADPDAALRDLKYFGFRGDFDPGHSDARFTDGTPILLSRTGYTGEIGFEIFLPSAKAGETWDKLLEIGAARGLLPCGLAARDSLRAGAVLPLSHQDIGGWPYINHPWPFALPPRQADGTFAKKFFGSDALSPEQSNYTLPFVGFDQRRVDSHAGQVKLDGKVIGRILTIVSDMAIGRVDGRVVGAASPDRPAGWTPRGLACGFVLVDRPLEPGAALTLADDRREIKVEVAADIRPNRSARKKLA